MSKRQLYLCLTSIMVMIQACSTPTALPSTSTPVMPSATVVFTSPTKTVTALPSECTIASLTPEECINLGSHSYSYVETAFTPCAETDTGITTFNISFESGGVVITSPENNDTTPDPKASQNTYSGTYETTNGAIYETTTVFTAEGFTSEYTIVSGSGCSTFSTYTLTN